MASGALITIEEHVRRIIGLAGRSPEERQTSGDLAEAANYLADLLVMSRREAPTEKVHVLVAVNLEPHDEDDAIESIQVFRHAETARIRDHAVCADMNKRHRGERRYTIALTALDIE